MTKITLSDRVTNMRPSATLAMAQAARELKASGVDVIALSAGEPDFATPKIITNIAKNSLDAGKTHYVPVKGTKDIAEALVEKFSRDQKVSYEPDQVMVTVGAKSAILLALEALINPGDEVLICAPYWVSYPEQIRLVGGIPKIITCTSQNNFMPTKDQIYELVNSKTKLLILNSPNNPSGALISKKQIDDIYQIIKNTQVNIISDEIYEKLIFGNQEHISPASLNDDMAKRTIVISGASKNYAMTGWRVGAVGGPKKIIGAMIKLQGQQTTCLPEFVQDAAAYAFRESQEIILEINRMKKAYLERKKLAYEKLQNIKNINIFNSQGAFYLWVDFSFYINKQINNKKVVDDGELCLRILQEAHVAIVPGSAFGMPGYVRMSIASSKEQISSALDRIASWLKN